jgi:hypothetical protein
VQHGAQGRPSSGKKAEAEARLNKLSPFIAGQDVGYEGRLANAQEASGWNERPWFLQNNETTKLAQNGQTSHGILPCERYVGPDNVVGNDRIARIKM